MLNLAHIAINSRKVHNFLNVDLQLTKNSLKLTKLWYRLIVCQEDWNINKFKIIITKITASFLSGIKFLISLNFPRKFKRILFMW